MSQVRENQISKQKKKVEMITTWQSEVSCDGNLTSQSHDESNDPLSTIYDNSISKNRFDKLTPEQKVFLNYSISRHGIFVESVISVIDVIVKQYINYYKKIGKSNQ